GSPRAADAAGARAAAAGWARVPAPVRTALLLPTALGATVLALGLACLVAGLLLGWRELLVVGAAGLLLVALAVYYTLGRTQLAIEIDVVPPRVTVGDQFRGTVSIRNTASRRLAPLRVELPVRAGATALEPIPIEVPALAPGAEHRVLVTIPAARRGVLTTGPATSVRGDPLGLLRREVTWTEAEELFIHPATVAIENLGAGLLRDLEGQTTNDLSMNDVAFHALREYVPGDDLRHVHAFTSARVGKLMVRQFVDTRTAHLAVVVSGAAREYAGPEQFEVACSVGGSLAVRAVDDQQRVSVIAAGHSAPARLRQSRGLVLDQFSRAEFGAPGSDLVTSVVRTSRVAPDVSLAVLVTGALMEVADMQAAAARFGPDVRVVGVRVVDGARPAAQRAGQLSVLTIPNLADLRTVLRVVVRS
ncbi:DUF58 domain-containing protein, partial [Luedemannella helvata]|uniref:DUF58 domain-containing protein n=1 Tax=Luedemannella helvata TaxID=349315 RepID=UPI0031DA65C8